MMIGTGGMVVAIAIVAALAISLVIVWPLSRLLARLARLLARSRSRFEAERRAGYAALAARFGLTFEESPEPSLTAEFPELAFVLSGPAAVLVRGTVRSRNGAEVDVVAGELLKPMPNLSARLGPPQSFVPVAFVILGPRAGRMPRLDILPEAEQGALVAFLSAVEEAVRPRDIDFESSEFSRRFHVAGDDRRFAYDLIDAAMIEHLLAASPDPVAWIRGDRVLLHRYGLAPAGPEAVASLLGWGLEFAARIPRVARDGLAKGRYGRDSS